MKKPELSIVIPTMGRTILVKTIESILSTSSTVSLEVLVIGEIADREVLQRIEALTMANSNIRHISISWPDGDSSRKKNRGADEAQANIVAFLDDDVIVAPDWPRHIIDAFQEPEVGLVSGPSLVPDGLNLSARLAGLVLSSRAAGYVADRYRAADNQVRDVTWSRIIGCNAAYRKEVFLQMGGFPPEFYPGEEMIAAWRTGELGYKLKFIPSAWVYHYPRQSLARFARQMREYGATRIRLIRAGVPTEWVTLVPAIWTLSLLILGVTAPFFQFAGWLLAANIILYAMMTVGIAAETALRTKRLRDLLAGLMVPIMHLNYGIGQLRECLAPGRDFSVKPKSAVPQ